MGGQMNSNHSIYTHAEEHIDQFLYLYDKYSAILPKPCQTIHNELDQKASVFNIWLQLIDSSNYRVVKHDRMIFHELTAAYHYYITNHIVTEKFKECETSDTSIFIYAYFASYFLNEYVAEELTIDTYNTFKKEIQTYSFFELTDDFIEQVFGRQLFNTHRELHYRLVNDDYVQKKFFEFLLEAYNRTIQVIEKNNLYELK